MKKSVISTGTSRRKSLQVEYKANLQKIADLFDQGYSKKDTYEFLYEKGYISMSYRHFCRFNSEGNLDPKKKKKRTRPSKPLMKNPNKDFDHQNIVTDEEFKKMTG